MGIDIRTIIVVLGITHLLQILVLSYQYKINKTYQGVGWWLLWSITVIIGFIFMLLRQNPFCSQLAIVGQNIMITLGVVFIYIGILRFLDKKENQRIILSALSAFILIFIYFVYIQNNIYIRSIVLCLTWATISFITAYTLYTYQKPSIRISANFTCFIFLIHGGVFTYRTVMILAGTQINEFFAPTLFNSIPYLDGLIVGLLWTYGLIMMLNQRLAADILETNKHFELIFNISPDATIISRLNDGLIVDINDGYTALSGYTRNEVIGKSSLKINIWNNPEDRQKVVDEVTSKGFCDNYETVFIRKDTTKALGLMSAKLLTLQGVPHILSVIRDITNRNQAESYHEMGREILQILNEPIAISDAIQHVLATLKERTGFDAVGIRLQEGEDFPYYTQQGFSKDFLLTENTLLEYTADGGMCRNEDGSARLECTCGLVICGKADHSNPFFSQGGSFWTNDSFPLLDLTPEQEPRYHPRNICIHQGYASVALIPIRNKERIVGLIHLNDRRKGCFTLETVELLEGIASHIGSALMRKRAETELQESEELFRSTFENHSAIKLLIDPNTGNILEANQSAANYYGWSKEQLRKMNIQDINTLTPEEVKSEIEKVRGPHRNYFEFHHRRADGSIRDVAVFCSIITTKGKDIIHSIIHDITEQKQAEEEKQKLQEELAQSQKLESIGRLAGGIAHDFNNMLQTILGYTEMTLEEVGPDNPLRENFLEIQKAGLHSAELTRQLLAFARKQAIAPVILNLNNTVAGMLKMLSRLIGEDIDLVWKPGLSLWKVKMDPSQIDQILVNLTINAKDSITGVGKITIETDTEEFDKDYCSNHTGYVPGKYVLLAVSDTGCGMDETTFAHIFEPFYTTKEMGHGTGLGLSTIYGIVQQNKGFINVSSEPGMGTTFKIYFPAKEELPALDEELGAPVEIPGGTETILLVEDEQSLLQLAQNMLKKSGYTIIAANNPVKAIQLAQAYTGTIHLLITDVVMPDMNGPDLYSEICKLRTGIPCIYMSGYTKNSIASKGILSEGVNFVQKPFTRETLALKIREVLSN